MKTVQRYQTADSKIFNSQQEAARHEKDLTLGKIGIILDTWFTSGNKRTDYQALCRIEEDMPLFKAQLKELLYIIDFNGDLEE